MKISHDFIPLFRGIDMSYRRLPLLIAEADSPGPTICLTAAIHGDEVTGTAVIQSVFKRFEDEPLICGKVYAFPILNPTGFEAISRRDLYGWEDLNRSFGKDPEGSTSERHAYIIFEAIKAINPDLVVDLHTDSMNSIAYTIIDDFRDQDSSVREKIIELAQVLRFPWAFESDQTAGYEMVSSLSGYLISQKIPAVTVELGGPLVVMETFRKAGLEAVWNLLFSKNMVATSPKDFHNQRQEEPQYFLERIRTQSTGLIDFRIRPGEYVREGQTLGKIRNVFGETIEMIKAPTDCMVFSHEDQSVTFPGQELFTLVRK